MADLQEVRIVKAVAVKVSGQDRNGHEFQQSATTVNVSRYGARLTGIACVDSGKTVEVSAGWFRKARFRVVWAGAPGTPEAAQIGLRALDSKANLWDIDFPPPTLAPSAAQRKKKPVVKTPVDAGSGPIAVKFDSVAEGPLTYERPKSFEISSEFVHFADEQAAPQPQSSPGGRGTVVGQGGMTKTTRTMRSDRRVPITLRYASGMSMREEAQILAQVQPDGSCMVEIHEAIPQGSVVEIVHGYSKETRRGRVAMSSPANAAGTHPVAIDVEGGDSAFWTATK